MEEVRRHHHFIKVMVGEFARRLVSALSPSLLPTRRGPPNIDIWSTSMVAKIVASYLAEIDNG